MVWARGGSAVSGPVAGGPGLLASPTLTPRYPPCLCLSYPGGLATGRCHSSVSRASPCAWLRSGHTFRGITLHSRCGLALRSPLTLLSLGGGEKGSFSATKNGTPFSGTEKAQGKARVSKAQGKARVLEGGSQGGGVLHSSVSRNKLKSKSPIPLRAGQHLFPLPLRRGTLTSSARLPSGCPRPPAWGLGDSDRIGAAQRSLGRRHLLGQGILSGAPSQGLLPGRTHPQISEPPLRDGPSTPTLVRVWLGRRRP